LNGPEARERVLRLRSLQAALEDDWRSVQQNAWDAVEVARRDFPDDVKAAACATYLLRFYSGLEQLLQRIADELNGGAPTGARWHRELLEQMARPVPRVRPAVLPSRLKEKLDEYRRFRHRMTRAYGVPLAWSRMRHLVAQLDEMIGELGQALAALHRFIDDLCRALDED